MTTSDTPRTDAFCDDASNEIDRIASSELVGFARQLERENNALREQLADTKQVNEILEQHVDDARHNEYEAQSQLAEKDAALAVCTQLYIEVNEIRMAVIMDDVGDNVLDNVNSEALNQVIDVLANLPESTKQVVKVLEAAKELSDEWEQGAQPSVEMFRKLCQAVRGMSVPARPVG